jgi:regulatory protein
MRVVVERGYMKITAIEEQVRRADRWNVYVDGAFAFALDGEVVVREGLTAGLELAPEDVERLRAAGEEQDLLAAALHFLGPRPRSRTEVRRRLLRPGPRRAAADEALVERVLERLEASGLLNDHDFAEFWVENRERFSPRSARALGVELRQRGVDRETVAEAADPERDEERALAAGRQKLRTLKGLDFATFRDRLGPFLLRRGFSYAVARATVRQLWEEMGRGAAGEEEDDA